MELNNDVAKNHIDGSTYEKIITIATFYAKSANVYSI